MAIDLNPYIQQLSWAEARELILPVNPEFVQHVDELELPKECGIFKVKYRYGDYLLKDGQFMLRNTQGDNVSIDHPDIPEIVKKKLSYAPTVPMGINLNKSIETYFSDIHGRVIPLYYSEQGSIFGLAGVLHQYLLGVSKNKFWNITAGARSVYSAPKISIGYKHKKLAREFGVGLAAPRGLEGHFETFKELLQSEKLKNHWQMESLFFSQEFPVSEESVAWKIFNRYLYQYIWAKTLFLRNLYQCGYIIAQAAASSNVRCNPVVITTLKQLVFIADGFIPGLSFAEDESGFPQALLKNIYRDIYGLEYPAMFMQTRAFNEHNKTSVYYSLATPGTLEYFPDFNPFKSKFDELRELAYATQKIQCILNQKTFGITSLEESMFRGFIKNEILFYHEASGGEQNISPSRKIPELSAMANTDYYSSSLLRGLIGIHPK